MKRIQHLGAGLLACLAVIASVGTAVGQTATVGQTAAIGHLDAATSGSNVRVSQLMGANIENPQGESVGEIKDIVVDAATGKVRYAAVTYGGVLGMGNKLFAVPWAAFKSVQDPDDATEYHLVLNVTQKTLDGAEGFDEEHWPNFGDEAWGKALDTRYGVKPSVSVNVHGQ